MENIKFEIKPSDIQEYIQNLRKNYPDIYEEYYQDKEAMFVKYMKERSTEITAESLEILMNKYNFDDVSPALGIYNYSKSGNIIQNGLYNFPFYLSNIKNLDISGISHIMVPVLTYYDKVGWHCYQYHKELKNICRKMGIEIAYDTLDFSINNMKDNYLIGFGTNFIFQQNGDTYFKLSKEKSRRMIQEYSSIYGEEPVKQIRKIVRERVQ